MNVPFLPMLAVRGEPFDSEKHLFELKWNGVRALAAVEQQRYRLWGRNLADYRHRYPELKVLNRLPPGTVLDGEVVLLRRGLPDFDALLARHHSVGTSKVRHLGQDRPVTYMVFDALCHRGRCLFGEPLQVRREILQELLDGLQEPGLLLSEGIVGAGQAFFEEAVRQGQEGIMAKHLASRYLPGRRSSAWVKMKPALTVPCVVIGFVPGRLSFRSLLVAASVQSRLHYVASISAGFSDADRVQLQALLDQRVRPLPIVPCPHRGVWVDSDLYCQVRYLERTANGRLRGASFQGLLDTPSVG